MKKDEPKMILRDKRENPGVMREMLLAEKTGISLFSYMEEGYDADQLDGIRYALENGVEIAPYLNKEYRGACIREIAMGLKEGLSVDVYEDLRYTWRKMREIRLGLMQHLNVSVYQDPLYSYWQMDICRHHHERYDGNGYPDGLKGEEIPLSAQIVAVADVYDALVHERVYKDAIPKNQAYEMIMNGECGVFSPELLHCLTNCREKMEAL